MTDQTARSYVTAEDVRNLRREMFPDGVISRAEAERLIALAERSPDGDPEWREFYVEALTAHLVDQARPEGYVSPEDADWLVSGVRRDGRVETAMELEAVVHILERAKEAPASLAGFALQQVKATVLRGEGPGREGAFAPGVVTAEDVKLMRRVVFARAGGGRLKVTTEEATAIYDIHDATASAENDPSWREFFVKTMANYLMAHFAFAPPTRAEAAHREAWLERDGRTGVGGFFGKMFRGGPRAISGAYRLERDMAEQTAARDRARMAEARAAEQVTGAEAGWLTQRIQRDGVLHADERALIAYLKTLGAELPESLRSLVDRAA